MINIVLADDVLKKDEGEKQKLNAIYQRYKYSMQLGILSAVGKRSINDYEKLKKKLDDVNIDINDIIHEEEEKEEFEESLNTGRRIEIVKKVHG